MTLKFPHWQILTASLLASFILYGSTMGGQFVYDDFFFVDRPQLRQIGHLNNIWIEPMLLNAGLYRPLTTTSFSLNFLLFGENPFTFRVFNLLLNGINAFLVFILISKLFKNSRLAVLTALIFSFLPIHTEVVANIKSRDELLSAFFMLLSWIVLEKAVSDNKRLGWKLLALSSFLFLLAIFSKELVVFGIIAPIVFYWIKNKPHWIRLIKVTSVYIPVILIYLVLRLRILGIYALGSDDLNYVSNPLKVEDFTTTFLTGLGILYTYTFKTFIPLGLSATYHFNHFPLVKSLFASWQAIAGLVILLIGIIAVIHKKIRPTPVGAGFLIFFANYFVFSQFLFKAGDMLAERWMYFPSIGLAAILGFLIEQIYRKNNFIALGILGIILLLFTAVIFPRNKVWLSNEALYKSMVDDAPNSIQGHYSLAQIYFTKGEVQSAKKHLEEAFKIYPKHPSAVDLASAIAQKEGNVEEAERLLKYSLTLDPALIKTYLAF